MKRLQLSAALGLAAALALLPRPVIAEPSDRVTLRWSAPEGCPGAAYVVTEVDRLLGARGARPPRPISASASVVQDERGAYRVRIETGEGEARVREVRGASCTAIADATALILALMIDPAAVSEREPATPATSPPPPPGPPRASVPPASTPRAPRPAPGPPAVPMSFRIATFVAGDVGSLPGLAFGLGGTAAFVYGPLRVELGISAWPGSASALSSRPTAGGDVSLVAGDAGGCFLFPIGRFELAPCAAFELGRTHASGFGVSTPSEGAALWSAVHTGALATWYPIYRLGLSLRLDAVVPFTRPRFVLENVGPVHRASPVAGRAAFGVELRL